MVLVNKQEQVCSDNVCIQFGSSLHLKTILLIILTHKSFMMMKTRDQETLSTLWTPASHLVPAHWGRGSFESPWWAPKVEVRSLAG